MAKETETAQTVTPITHPSKLTLNYSVTILDLEKHYFFVELEIISSSSEITLVLPNWTPGSYMIRDYSTHIHKMTAVNSRTNEVLEIEMVDLNQWKVINPSGEVKVSYTVYAFEDYTVRTNYLTNEFGFISPPAFFFYPKGELSNSVKINFLCDPVFPFVFSSLKRMGNSNQFLAEDFDELYDSPFHLSKVNSIFFEVGPTLHELVVEGDVNFSFKEKLAEDLKKITAKQIEWMKESPNPYYLFVVNLSIPAYGGLEHRASSINFFNAELLSDEKEYSKLLELLSHEYFHLWNIKRIRPINLGPFDYEKPNLTRELWIAEGVTSFYDNFFLLQSGFLTPDEYLQRLESDIFSLEESTGENWMSLEESSFTAWTKYYKRNANSHNVTVSYYTKGAVLTLCLNLYLIKHSKERKSLRDVYHKLNDVFVKEKKRGFTKQEFFETILSVTGVDLRPEFLQYIEKPKRLPVEDFLSFIGIKKIQSEPIGDFGFRTKEKEGNLIVHRITHSEINSKIEIQLEDEIIAINGKRINSSSFSKFEKQILPNETYHLLISRNGKIKEIMMKANMSFKVKKLVFSESITEETKMLQTHFFEGMI